MNVFSWTFFSLWIKKIIMRDFSVPWRSVESFLRMATWEWLLGDLVKKWGLIRKSKENNFGNSERCDRAVGKCQGWGERHKKRRRDNMVPATWLRTGTWRTRTFIKVKSSSLCEWFDVLFSNSQPAQTYLPPTELTKQKTEFEVRVDKILLQTSTNKKKGNVDDWIPEIWYMSKRTSMKAWLTGAGKITKDAGVFLKLRNMEAWIHSKVLTIH